MRHSPCHQALVVAILELTSGHTLVPDTAPRHYDHLNENVDPHGTTDYFTRKPSNTPRTPLSPVDVNLTNLTRSLSITATIGHGDGGSRPRPLITVSTGRYATDLTRPSGVRQRRLGAAAPALSLPRLVPQWRTPSMDEIIIWEAEAVPATPGEPATPSAGTTSITTSPALRTPRTPHTPRSPGTPNNRLSRRNSAASHLTQLIEGTAFIATQHAALGLGRPAGSLVRTPSTGTRTRASPYSDARRYSLPAAMQNLHLDYNNNEEGTGPSSQPAPEGIGRARSASLSSVATNGARTRSVTSRNQPRRGLRL